MRTLIVLIALGLTACNSDGSFNPTISSSASSSGSSATVYSNFMYATGLNNENIQVMGIDAGNGRPEILNNNYVSQTINVYQCGMALHPNKKFLYSANCKLNGSNISQFAIDDSTGLLSRLSPYNPTTFAGKNGAGIITQNVGFDASGNLYATQYYTSYATYGKPDRLLKFSVNSTTGQITYVNAPVSNSPGSDLVTAYIASNAIQMSNFYGATGSQTLSIGSNSYKITFGTDNIFQFQGGSEVYSVYAAQPYQILIK
jgi:hypothetical protein